MDITEPIRLAIGSHRAGTGLGCAMNVVAWEQGDTVITDVPSGVHPELAVMVHLINDRMIAIAAPTSVYNEYHLPTLGILARRKVEPSPHDLVVYEQDRLVLTDGQIGAALIELAHLTIGSMPEYQPDPMGHAIVLSAWKNENRQQASATDRILGQLNMLIVETGEIVDHLRASKDRDPQKVAAAVSKVIAARIRVAGVYLQQAREIITGERAVTAPTIVDVNEALRKMAHVDEKRPRISSYWDVPKLTAAEFQALSAKLQVMENEANAAAANLCKFPEVFVEKGGVTFTAPSITYV